MEGAVLQIKAIVMVHVTARHVTESVYFFLQTSIAFTTPTSTLITTRSEHGAEHSTPLPRYSLCFCEGP